MWRVIIIQTSCRYNYHRHSRLGLLLPRSLCPLHLDIQIWAGGRNKTKPSASLFPTNLIRPQKAGPFDSWAPPLMFQLLTPVLNTTNTHINTSLNCKLLNVSKRNNYYSHVLLASFLRYNSNQDIILIAGGVNTEHRVLGRSEVSWNRLRKYQNSHNGQ